MQKYITLFDPKKAVNVNVRELGNTTLDINPIFLSESGGLTTTGIVMTPPKRSPTKG